MNVGNMRFSRIYHAGSNPAGGTDETRWKQRVFPFVPTVSTDCDLGGFRVFLAVLGAKCGQNVGSMAWLLALVETCITDRPVQSLVCGVRLVDGGVGQQSAVSFVVPCEQDPAAVADDGDDALDGFHTSIVSWRDTPS